MAFPMSNEAKGLEEGQIWAVNKSRAVEAEVGSQNYTALEANAAMAAAAAAVKLDRAVFDDDLLLAMDPIDSC